MMKKIFYLAIIAIGFLSSCKKEEDILLDDPDTRLNAVLTADEAILNGAANGWKGAIYPAGGKGFSYYFKFNAGKVTMVSDFNATTASTPVTSTYRLKALQRPTLIFDTYSYIHLPADPNAAVSGGATGQGLKSDFEFAITDISADQIKLEGTVNKTVMVLTRNTAAEETSYMASGLKAMMDANALYATNNKYPFLQFADGTKIAISIDPTAKIFSMTWLDATGVVQNVKTTYAFGLNGLTLNTPLTYLTNTFQNVSWDPTLKVYYVTIGSTRFNFQGSATPILPLHLLMGSSYTTIAVPNATTNPGWGADFVTRRAAAAAATLASPYGLRLDKMDFIFNSTLQTLTLNADVYQSATRFVATYTFTYTKTSAGVYKFTAQPATGNAALIVNEMAPLLGQRLNVNQFTLDYFVDPVKGTVGQFISVENPTFTFTGSLL